MQRVNPVIWMAFQPVKDDLRDTFLPALFQRDTSHILGRAITSLPVKQGRIALPEPTQTDGANWMAPYVITRQLAVALRETADFRLGDHALMMREGREEI